MPPIIKPPIGNKIPGTLPGKRLKVLQLSDTHWDPFYAEGSNAECGEPMCCRETSGPVMDERDKAGFWGDYRYYLFVDLL